MYSLVPSINNLPFGNSLNVYPISDIEETFINTGKGSNLVLSINNNSGASGPTNQQGEPWHPGVWRVRTGNSNGSSVGTRALGIGGLTSYCLLGSFITCKWQLKYVGPAATNADDVNTCVGLFISTNNLFTPTTGIYFHCNYATYGDNFFRIVVAKSGGLSPRLVKPTTIPFDGITRWSNFEIAVHGYLSPGNRYIEFGYSNEDLGYRIDTDLIGRITEAELSIGNVLSPFTLNDIMSPGFTLQKPQFNSINERQLWYDSVRIGDYYVI